ncbi:MAG: CheY-like chemotaxis protein [Candidatus Azotimanducaceae bacterium]
MTFVQEIKNHQVSFLNYEGNRVFALCSAQPVHDKNGKFKGCIGAAKDITSIKRAEEELREKEKTLHHNQKLEALGQLTSGVAHDFNNLLTVVGCNLELLENAALPAEHRSKVDFQTECSTEVWLCQADEGQLEIVVLNLALNARDAMSGKGRLILRAKNHVQMDTDESLRQGEYVRLSVGDTGVGIEEDEMTRIIEPFYTSKPAGQGTGLGLSMVYGFAQQSGGCLEIESQPGVGSTFSILLPRAYGPALASPEESSTSDPLDKCIVMVVEDDIEVLNVIILILKSVGIEVLSALNGEEALQMQGTVNVDLVISDLMLGQGMSGVEVAETLSDRWPGMPLLLISGNADHLLSKSELEQYKPSLLREPFGNQQLIAAIREKLNQQQRQDVAI